MYKFNLSILLRAIDWSINKYLLRRKTFKRKLQDVEMHLDLVTPGISKVLAIYKTREDDMVQIIKEVLKPGMTVIDCGSNIGFYPLLESRILNGKGVIYAVEPDIRNYRILEKNACIQPSYTEIKTFNIALSNNSGYTKCLLLRGLILINLFRLVTITFQIGTMLMRLLMLKQCRLMIFVLNKRYLLIL